MNRAKFPAVVAADADGRVLVDNGAGAQLPENALERMNRFATYDNAPKGRGFPRAQATLELIAAAKTGFAEIIEQPVDRVGLAPNATSTALAFSRLIARTIRRGDRIVVTAADHAANIAPWTWLRGFGAQIEQIPVNASGDLDEAAFHTALELDPILVALPWASNATGTIFDVARYARAAKAAGATVVVDAVQALPHFALTLDTSVDLAFFSAYKMYAPHMGFWYLNPQARRRFLSLDDADVPGGDARVWTLEPGTQNHEALAGWLGTLEYFREIASTPRAAMAKVADYEADLAKYAREKFAERAPSVHLYGRTPDAGRLPLFTFNVNGMSSEDLAARFERAHIEAREGDCFCPALMRTIARDANGRAVRISFAHYNTTADVDRCFEVIDAAVSGALENRVQPGDTVARFNARAGDYARYRPSYPPEAIAEVLAGLGDSPLVADVGAGTGISAALLAGGGARVIAIEPNAEMRAVATAAGLDARDGRADALGLATGSVDAVTAFQAFHWFANAATVAEFRRVLRPGGRVALVWNERDDRDPFTRGYGEIVDGFNSRMQAFSGLERGEQGLETLLTLDGFQDYRLLSYPNAQTLDYDGLLGRVRSSSYAPREGAAHVALLARLAELYEEFRDASGSVRLVYRTDVHLAQS